MVSLSIQKPPGVQTPFKLTNRVKHYHIPRSNCPLPRVPRPLSRVPCPVSRNCPASRVPCPEIVPCPASRVPKLSLVPCPASRNCPVSRNCPASRVPCPVSIVPRTASRSHVPLFDNTTAELFPPNPNEFESTCLTSTSCFNSVTGLT